MVASKPLGTKPTMIPTAKMRLVIASYPITNPNIKKKSPTIIAKVATNWTNLFNSFLIGVSSPPADAARFAIYPITVLSPVKITIPLPEPLNFIICLLLYKVFQKKPDFLFQVGSLCLCTRPSSKVANPLQLNLSYLPSCRYSQKFSDLLVFFYRTLLIQHHQGQAKF